MKDIKVLGTGCANCRNTIALIDNDATTPNTRGSANAAHAPALSPRSASASASHAIAWVWSTGSSSAVR